MEKIENEDISVSSSNECTGLMPTIPEEEEEEEAYKELFPFAPKRKKH